MVTYRILFHRKALKDIQHLKEAGLAEKAKRLVEILKQNPFQNPPPYEKLVGDLKGYYSRRINIQHRIWYSVDESTKTVRIIRMWTHYQE